MDSLTWVIFDIMGTIAFAVSGAMVAIQRRMDIFGIIVLAALTAVGGGMVRDGRGLGRTRTRCARNGTGSCRRRCSCGK